MKKVLPPLMLAAFAGSAFAQPAYEAVVVDAFVTTYNLRETYIWDVSEQGRGVGLTTILNQLPGGSSSITYAGFSWTEAAGKTPHGDSTLTAVNNLGQATGWGQVFDTATGVSTPLPGLPGAWGTPYTAGINDAGVVTGYQKTCNCSNSNGMSQIPYLWDAAGGARTINIPDAKSAGRINAAGLLVGGIKYSPGLPDAFVYDVNTGQYTVLGTLLPAPTQSTAWTTASDVNDAGMVVGVRRSDDALVYRGFVWSAATGFAFLPEPGPGFRPDVRPATINNAGVVAGYIETTSGDGRAFVWDAATGMRDLNDLTTGLPAEFVLRRASRINDQGWIVGYGQGGGGFSKGFVLKPIESAPCYPDCNADGALNLADFGCFQTRFALGDERADCNADGVLNLSDFGCFQTKFALGCP